MSEPVFRDGPLHERILDLLESGARTEAELREELSRPNWNPGSLRGVLRALERRKLVVRILSDPLKWRRK